MRREFEGETIFFAYVTPTPSLLVSQELNTPFPFRNENVKTVVFASSQATVFESVFYSLDSNTVACDDVVFDDATPSPSF